MPTLRGISSPARLAVVVTVLVWSFTVSAPGGPRQEVGVAPREIVPARAIGGQQGVIRTIGGQAQPGLDLRAIRIAVVPEPVRVLVARLDHPDWTTRETAARELHDGLATDEALMRILDQDSLSEEQRQRLLSVVTRRIRERERGAIGIRMTPVVVAGLAGQAGVEVTEVIRDLPAERVLRQGDIIVRIDDRPIRDNTDLITHVQQLRPGHVIHVSVLRPVRTPEPGQEDPNWVRWDNGRWFEPVQVEFALGSFEKLGETRGVTNPETQRRERLVAEARSLWDRTPITLEGPAPLDGVVRPGIKPADPGSFRPR